MEEVKKIEVKTSKQFSVNLRDIATTFLMTGIGAIILPLIESLEKWTIVTDWRKILIGGLTAGLSQFWRKFFSQSQTIVKVTPPVTEAGKQEIKEAVQDHIDEKT